MKKTNHGGNHRRTDTKTVVCTLLGRHTDLVKSGHTKGIGHQGGHIRHGQLIEESRRVHEEKMESQGMEENVPDILK